MKISKKILLFTVIVLFLISLVRIAPLVYKGYAPAATYDNLIMARNLALEGVYKMENKKNVVLAPSRVAGEGVDSTLGNKFTIYLHALIFKIFGFKKELPFYISVFMFAISGILIFLLVLRLFNNYWLALSAFLFDLAMPFVWKGSLWPVFYEFASVFFLVGLLLYFWKEEKSRLNLILSGVFFGLAAVSRNAFLLSAAAICLYELYALRPRIKFLYLVIPVMVIFGAMGAVSNSYLSSSDESFTDYGHLFPDPYTYHFERESFVESVKNNPSDYDITQFLLKYNYKVPFWNQVKMYFGSASIYIKQLFSLINFGGPIFLFFAILGGLFLFKERRKLFYLIVFWLVFWYASLIVLKTNNWDHFLEIRFAIILLIVLGIWKLIAVFSGIYNGKTAKILFGGGLVLFLFLQLFFSNKWLFHQDYESSFFPEGVVVINCINRQKINENEVIAVSFHQTVPLILNYYTDRSFIYFASETIEKLKKENRLEEVFRKFGATRYLANDACGFKK